MKRPPYSGYRMKAWTGEKMIRDELRTFRAYAVRAHTEHPGIYGGEETAKAVLGNLDDLIASTRDHYTATSHGEAVTRLGDIHRSLIELAVVEPRISPISKYKRTVEDIASLLAIEKVRDAAVRGHQARRSKCQECRHQERSDSGE